MEKFIEIPHDDFENQHNELWRNIDVISVSFRRHSRYDYAGGKPSLDDPEARPKGSLTKQGIELAREQAKKWKESLPADSNITIFESPSYMVAGERQTPETHLLLPSRARQTASIYEKEIFGDLAPTETVDDSLNPIQSQRRKRAYLLGDFMENVTEDGAKFIKDFFKIRSEVYGSDMHKFWEDYTKNILDSRVQDALEKCGASTSKDLASNLIEFLKKISEETEADDKKRIDLALTHGETMESFLYHVSRFLIENEQTEDATILENVSFGYNEGLDVHIERSQLLIEWKNKIIAVGSIDDVIRYLSNHEPQ